MESMEMNDTSLMILLLGCFIFARLLLELYDCLFSLPPNPDPDPIAIPRTHDHRQEAASNHEEDDDDDEEERLQQHEMRITDNEEWEDEEEPLPLCEIRITDNEEGEDEQQQEKMQNIRENCTECAICFEVFTDDDGDGDDLDNNEQQTTVMSVWVLKECGHKFHKQCLTPWLKICRFNATCPNCRCPVKS